MDYFKRRAREILLGDGLMDAAGSTQVNYDSNYSLSLGNAYKNLKNLMNNPVVVHGSVTGIKPNYMKMTFSTCRQAVNGERFMELAKLGNKPQELSQMKNKLPPLMRAGKG